MEKFRKTVEEIFTDYFLMEILDADYSKPFEEVGLDLLDQVDLIMQIERTFNLSIPDDECEKFVTIDDIGRYMSSVGIV